MDAARGPEPFPPLDATLLGRNLAVSDCWAGDPTASNGLTEHDQANPSIDPFRYSSLPNHGPYIRLLVLRPAAAFSDAIECDLLNASLADSPIYQALSYAWGDPTPTRTMLLSQSLFGVTKNLELAIRHLRLKSKVRVLWVDAICIDQDNLAERSHQVTMMAHIYKSAQKVLIWLGGDAFPETPNHSFIPPQEVISRLATAATDDVENLADGIETGTWVGSVVFFVSLPWFSRLWVLQELAMGVTSSRRMFSKFPEQGMEYPDLVFGHWSLPWHAFWIAFRRIPPSFDAPLFSRERLAWEFHGPEVMINLCVDAMTHRNGNVADRLAKLLFYCRGRFKTNEPRDRLFGLLGLLGNLDEVPREPALVPNYEKPVARVFVDLAKYLILQRKTLDILCGYGSISKRILEIPGMPSWTPDWGETLQDKSIQDYLPQFRGDNPPLVTPAAFRFSDDSRILFAQGVRVDILSIIGTRAFLNSIDPDDAALSAQRALFSCWENELLRSDLVLKTGKAADQLQQEWKSLIFHSSEKDKFEAESYLYDLLMGRRHSNNLDLEVRQFAVIQSWNLRGKTTFVTSQGHIGITDGDFQVEQNDIVCVFLGGPVPFILRKESGYYRFVGASIIVPLMGRDGQQTAFRQGVMEEFGMQ